MFGNSVDVGDSIVRKYYTGVQNFEVTAINPTKGELEKMYGRDINYDPEYIGTTTVTDGAGEREVTQIRLDFFLRNEIEDLSLKASFYLVDTFHKGQSGKFKVINDFGNTTWLTEEDIKSGDVPENMQWYNKSGMKIAKRGEEEVIDFLKNLLNLPIDLSKVTDVTTAYARFPKEELVKIFAGDVSMLSKVILNTNNKIGLLLGVKTKADNGMVQAVYNRKTLRQYIMNSTKADKFKYIQKDLAEAKANGAYGNVEFGPLDMVFREHSITPSSLNTSNLPPADDVFGNPSEISSEGDEDWMNV